MLKTGHIQCGELCYSCGMRLFAKLMILLVIAALAGPFFLKGPDGRPLWTIASVKAKIAAVLSSTRSDIAGGLEDVGVDAASNDVEIFRWQDASGQWHFSTEAPAGIDADTMTIDPDTNLVTLPALPEAPQPEPEVAAPTEQAPVQTAVPEGYPDAEETRQLLEDVRNMQNVVDEREKRIRDID